MTVNDLNKGIWRWLLLAIITLIVLIIRIAENGFFQENDWLLYLILPVSSWYSWHYFRKNRTS